MKMLMRHGLAVSLALTTMCTSLLLMYGSIGGGAGAGGGGGGGGGGGRKEQSREQQVAVTASQKPENQQQLATSGQRRPPALPDRPLDGYISVLDHKQEMPSHHPLLLASLNELVRHFWTLFKQHLQLH